MTWVDIVFIVLVLGYAGLGFFTGALQRLIGLVALYLAFVAATNMGIQAGGILQQTSSFEIADGRIYGFFGIIFAVLLIVEVATQLAHSQIQIPAVILNRTLGAIVGVFTAILLSYVVVYEVAAAANPIGGAQLDHLQQSLRDSVQHSLYMTKLVDATNRPIIALFQPLLPVDPQQYFSSNPVNP